MRCWGPSIMGVFFGCQASEGNHRYCILTYDAKIAALEAENATLKEQIQNLYNLYEQIRG